MIETWKDIIGFEGYYEVSNLGNIRTVERYINYPDGSKHLYKSKPIKLRPSVYGYNMAWICKDCKKKGLFVHREVAKSFLPNPENKPQVNHINGIKTDNKLENLEWCTQFENMQHSFSVLKRENCRKGKVGCPSTKKKTVIQCSLDGFVVGIFDSMKKASRDTGIKFNQILICINKKQHSAGGYLWL